MLKDKNLGLIEVSRDNYVKDLVNQFFSDRKIYDIASKEEAQEHFVEVANAFLKFVSSKSDSIGIKDLTYTQISLVQETRIWDIPVFRLDSLLGQGEFMHGQRAVWKTRCV